VREGGEGRRRRSALRSAPPLSSLLLPFLSPGGPARRKWRHDQRRAATLALDPVGAMLATAGSSQADEAGEAEDEDEGKGEGEGEAEGGDEKEDVEGEEGAARAGGTEQPTPARAAGTAGEGEVAAPERAAGAGGRSSGGPTKDEEVITLLEAPNFEVARSLIAQRYFQYVFSLWFCQSPPDPQS